MKTARRGLGALLALEMAWWGVTGALSAWSAAADADQQRLTLPTYARPLEARNYASPGGIIAQMGEVDTLRLAYFLDRPAYVAYGPHADGLFDARTAERLSPLSSATAETIAARAFAGSDRLKRSVRTTFHVRSREVPAWRVEFGDPVRTFVIVGAETGEVLGGGGAFSAALAGAAHAHAGAAIRQILLPVTLLTAVLFGFSIIVRRRIETAQRKP